jgi:hypothetical protein
MACFRQRPLYKQVYNLFNNIYSNYSHTGEKLHLCTVVKKSNKSLHFFKM